MKVCLRKAANFAGAVRAVRPQLQVHQIALGAHEGQVSPESDNQLFIGPAGPIVMAMGFAEGRNVNVARDTYPARNLRA